MGMIAAPWPEGAEALSGCALSRCLPVGATTTQLKPHVGEIEGKGDTRAQLAVAQVDMSAMFCWQAHLSGEPSKCVPQPASLPGI